MHRHNFRHDAIYFVRIKRCDYYDLLFVEKNRSNYDFIVCNIMTILLLVVFMQLNHDENVMRDVVKLKDYYCVINFLNYGRILFYKKI
jgi:hypothetical protein